jgi:Rrf2 family protein
MKLSTRARYALRLMLDVAKNGRLGVPVSLAMVAERTDLSRGYLEQLAMGLKNARLIRGVCGKQGGYLLSRPAQEITLREIIEAVIGPVRILDCIEDDTTCMRAEGCECRLVYALINQRIVEVLQEFTLADMVDPQWNAAIGQMLAGMGGRKSPHPIS